MISLELLDKVDAFKGYDDDQLSKISSMSETLEFQKNDKLFTEGDEATHLWFIIDGQVDLRFELPDRKTTNEYTVTKVESHESVLKTFGWSCFVPPNKMRLSAYCVSRNCAAVRIEKSILNDFFDEDNKAGFLFFRYLTTVVGYRFQQFQNEVAKAQGNDIMHGW